MANNQESLQDLIDRTPDLVEYFRNDVAAPHFARANAQRNAAFIPPAFTNWRDEQYASFEGAALVHQSHHMPELFIEGPGALPLLQSVGVNSFANFGDGRAKQLIAATPKGHMIGDCIVYRHGDEKFELVSGKPIQNWVEYQAKHGGFDVEMVIDEASNANPTGRRVKYRLEIAGRTTGKILERVIEGGLPDIPFFHTRQVRIGDHDVLVLRHGMFGEIAVELSGPYDEEDAVRSILLDAGRDLGLIPIGTTTYFTEVQGGWIPYPVPGIFTDPALRNYREYLPESTWEAHTELGGSYVASDIDSYYVTPYDLGYGHIIKFDHDFHGKEALAEIPDEEKRQKVTLVWDREDVARIQRSQFEARPRYKAIDLPLAYYAWNQFDEVLSADGTFVGNSFHAAYLGPVADFLSMAIVDPNKAPIGSEVVLTWGEPGGGTRKPHVEQHEQTTIRARVAPAPYETNVQRNTRIARLETVGAK